MSLSSTIQSPLNGYLKCHAKRQEIFAGNYAFPNASCSSTLRIRSVQCAACPLGHRGASRELRTNSLSRLGLNGRLRHSLRDFVDSTGVPQEQCTHCCGARLVSVSRSFLLCWPSDFACECGGK